MRISASMTMGCLVGGSGAGTRRNMIRALHGPGFIPATTQTVEMML